MKKLIRYLGNKVAKNKILYYILNFTWGLPMTILGLLVALVLLPFGGRFKKFNYIPYVELNKVTGWGFSIGIIFVCGKNGSTDMGLKCHEFGHTVQNAMFGPFTPFVVYIPSAIRFWWRNFQWIRYQKWTKDYNGPEPKMSLVPYDGIWFEGTATEIGNDYQTYKFTLDKRKDLGLKNESF